MLTIDVKMDDKEFCAFAWFNAFTHQKRLRRLVLFVGIMLSFALLCFLMRGSREGAVLLGSVLVAVAVIIPLGYALSFYLSLRAQCKKLSLSTPKPVYTLSFSENEGMQASFGENTEKYHWGDISYAYRRKTCIYIYVSELKAFLLPDKCSGENAGAIWAMFEARMDSSRLKSV